MPAAEKLSITLPAEMVSVIRAKVEKGLYGSNSEVIRDALRDWMEQEEKLAALDEAIMRGLADIEAGRVHDIEDVERELAAEFGA